MVWQLGWVEIDLGYYTTCWAAGVMAEWAEQVGRLVELENLRQHNQLPDPHNHPVIFLIINKSVFRYNGLECVVCSLVQSYRD